MLRFLTISAVSLIAAATQPSVTTSSGPINGLTDGRANRFLGIPFAQSPPVRFNAPIPATTWSSPLNATKVRAACIQQFVDPPRAREFVMSVYNNPAPEESEDCLYLNVWAPANETLKPQGGWPVMFWLYGGDLQFGTGGMPVYDGSHLAGERGVVVVTSNYRTNVFGFPNSPALPAGEANLGFLDQRAALNWTAHNIAAFGGDPAKVTIFGQSAGGYSVKQLIANPPSPLNFRAAIMESEAQSPKDGPKAWQTITAKAGCADSAGQLECMRKVDARKLKSIAETDHLGFAPVDDGVTNSRDFATAVKSGKAAKIPIMIGTTSGDATFFALSFAFKATDTLGSALPALDMGTSDQINNLIFVCPAKFISNVLVEENYPAVYRYYWDASVPRYAPFPGAGSYHAIEIQPIFGTFKTIDEANAFQNASAIAQGGWVGFAIDPMAGPGWDSQTNTFQGKKYEPVGVITLDGLRQRSGGLGNVDAACADLDLVINAQGL